MTDLSPWVMPPVVLDCGSYYMKGGFCVDNHPLSVNPAVVGRPSYLNGGYGRYQYYDVLFADEAINNPEYDLSRPVVNGRIVQWDNMERLWHFMLYKELKVAPEDRAMFLGVASSTKMKEKIKCCEILFEALNVPAVCIQPNASLAMYGSGRVTGITVDIGYDITEITAIFEGATMNFTHIQTGYAGREVKAYMKKKLDELKVNLGPTPEVALDKIMQEVLFVTVDASSSRKRFKKFIENPDSKEKVDVTQIAFMASEMFFQPDLVMGEKSGFMSLVEGILNCLLRCDLDLRPDLYKGIVLVGGFALIPGLAQRLEIELNAVLEKPVTIFISDEANIVPWMGAACMAGIPEGYRLWVTKKQYEDKGDFYIRNRFIP